MGATMWRITKAFFIHFAILLIALLLIWLIVQGQEALSAEVRLRYRGRSGQALESMLGDARGAVMTWMMTAVAVSWLAASLFLVSAERAKPINEAQARGRLGLWSLMLMVTIGFLAATGWLNLRHAAVSGVLMPTPFLLAVMIGTLATLAAYYFATALAVRLVMRPSVPLASALPTWWN